MRSASNKPPHVDRSKLLASARPPDPVTVWYVRIFAPVERMERWSSGLNANDPCVLLISITTERTSGAYFCVRAISSRATLSQVRIPLRRHGSMTHLVFVLRVSPSTTIAHQPLSATAGSHP